MQIRQKYEYQFLKNFIANWLSFKSLKLLTFQLTKEINLLNERWSINSYLIVVSIILLVVYVRDTYRLLTTWFLLSYLKIRQALACKFLSIFYVCNV